MGFILKTSTNYHRENPPISNKVAIIILNKYSNASFCDIVLAEHYMPNKPLQYCRISSAHAVYILLYYVLLFFYSNTGWY